MSRMGILRPVTVWRSTTSEMARFETETLSTKENPKHLMDLSGYGDSPEEGRYSPGRVIDAYPVVWYGNPDEDKICTSHAERSNRTIRMQIRRFTRLTDAHSKKWENHEAALALFFCYYNYARVHMTLETRPAVQAGLADHVWSVAEMLANVGVPQ